MCGIAGLYLKNPALQSRIGKLFVPMLVELTDRGPDSAGFGLYRGGERGITKVTVYSPEKGYDWNELAQKASNALNTQITVERNHTHAVLRVPSEIDLRGWLNKNATDLGIMSSGEVLEIYKEVGLPADVLAALGLESMSGTQIVGHTRLATESGISTMAAHPFNTGDDLCLVHNGSVSNHHHWRQWLSPNGGIVFESDNDSEVAAAYLTWRLREGKTLTEALEATFEDLNGFFTFAVGTKNGFSVARDPIGWKHAIIAETDDWVAMATEYRAIAVLPDAKHAEVWEPKPATVYSWGEA